MKIINLSKNTILAENALFAATPWHRIKGLLGRKSLDEKEALVLAPCNSIHTFFMRFPIDVLFVSRENKVVGVAACLRPWRLSRLYLGASCAIEFPAGVIAATHTSPSDILRFE